MKFVVNIFNCLKSPFCETFHYQNYFPVLNLPIDYGSGCDVTELILQIILILRQNKPKHKDWRLDLPTLCQRFQIEQELKLRSIFIMST